MAKPGPLRRVRGTVAIAAGRTALVPWALLLLAALAVRVLYALSIRDAYFFHHLQTEALRYHQWATIILDGRRAPLPPFEQAPGYPYFVAVVYALCGRSVTAVVLVQAVLDAVTCVLVAVAGCHWFGARAGWIAGALAAIYGPLLFFTAEMLPSTLFLFVSMAAVTAHVIAWRQGTTRTDRAWTCAGSLWGLALLVRSEIVLAFPFVLFDAWRCGGRKALTRLGVPLIVIIAAMIGLNVAGSGAFVLFTTSGGVNLWLGNNPHADGVSPFVSGPLEAVADGVRKQATNAVEADRLFRRYALAFLRDEPGQAARLLWKKFLWTWTDRELPNTGDIEWTTGHSWLVWRPLFPLSFGMILPLAVAGAVLHARRRRELALLAAPLAAPLAVPLAGPLAALLVVGVGTSLIFFTNARFRLIMAPSLLLLAAVALDRLPPMLKAWRCHWRALLLAAVAFGGGSVAAWGDFYGVRTYRIPQISVNTGVLEREAGHLESAVFHLREGLAADPHDPIAWIHLALALEEQGQIDAARQAYNDALVQVPDDASLREMARRFFERHPGKG